MHRKIFFCEFCVFSKNVLWNIFVWVLLHNAKIISAKFCFFFLFESLFLVDTLEILRNGAAKITSRNISMMFPLINSDPK